MTRLISEQLVYIAFVEAIASISCIAIYLSFLWLFDPCARKVFQDIVA